MWVKLHGMHVGLNEQLGVDFTTWAPPAAESGGATVSCGLQSFSGNVNN